jgi:hypothetical protein
MKIGSGFLSTRERRVSRRGGVSRPTIIGCFYKRLLGRNELKDLAAKLHDVQFPAGVFSERDREVEVSA